MLVRLLLFVLVFGCLQLSWQGLEGSRPWHLVIDRGIVAPAASVAIWLSPERGVHADGSHLRGTGYGIHVVNGCDGMETLFLLVAGFAVAPLPVRARLWGIAAGIPLVYALNLGRILTLFYALQFDRRAFDWLHGLATPTLMVLAVAGFYHAWLRGFHPPANH